MIVTCEQCSTQFQLDDSKVPERGVRVRCSRCKHAFTVKPQTEAGDSVQRAVEDSLDDTSDLAADSMDQTAELAAEETADPAVDTAPLDDPIEESDWEFNHDPGAERQPATELDASQAGGDLGQDTADDLVAPADSDFTQAGSDPAAGFGDEVAPPPSGGEGDTPLSGSDGGSLVAGSDVDLSLAGEDGDPSLLDEAPSGLELGGGSSVGFDELGAGALDSGSLGDGSALDDSIGAGPLPGDLAADEPLAGEIGTGDPLADLMPPEPASSAGSEVGPLAEHEPEVAPLEGPETGSPQAPARPAADGLGSPENWDFFDDDDAPPAPRVGMKIALGRLGAPGAGRPPVEVETEPSRIVVWLERGVQGVGWTAVAVLALVGLYGGVAPGAAWTPALEAPTPRHIGGLELSSVRGGWTDNAVAGPVYVISGQLRNAETVWITPHSRLAVQLLDDRGGFVGEGEVAAVGTGVSVAQLRRMQPDELRATLAANADALAWTSLPPGWTRNFQAVLPALPEAATRFEIVAVPVEHAPQTGAESGGVRAPGEP